MRNFVRILGCGSSTGVPRIGNNWGACDPNNPLNRRTRCSLYIHYHGISVLIDTSPDLRQQLLSANVQGLDAVFYTHDHADQTHGIDDLRVLAMFGRKLLPVYADQATRKTLESRFSYCFNGFGDYPAILGMQGLEDRIVLKGEAGHELLMEPFVMHHGRIKATGYLINKSIAYTPDLHDLPEESFNLLENIDVWIVDALRYKPHPSHSHVAQSFDWIKKVGAKQGILTNMHIDVDYEEVRAICPDNIIPAYDGLEITLS